MSTHTPPDSGPAACPDRRGARCLDHPSFGGTGGRADAGARCQEGLTLWDEGAQTKEERSLGFRFVGGRSPTGASPDENGVMQLAHLWSIDPSSLGEELQGPVTGLQGRVAWAEGRTGQ
jgi:hypothetical protein